MLNETAPPVIGQPVLDELARYLKLPEPHEEAATAEAEDALRAAIAHLEAQLGLALIQRSFLWRTRLSQGRADHAPMAPVVSVTSVNRAPVAGVAAPLDLNAVCLDQSDLRTKISTRQAVSEPLDITFVAGFGATWADTPADLRRAAYMLAAQYFDVRHAAGESVAQTPHGVAALIAPWRPMRLGLGALR